MQPKSSKDIVNIAIIGTSSSGKTSLVEAIAYNVGLTTRLGTVQDGNTISDYLPEEIERQISIGLSVISFQYKNKKINIIDTPGFPDFIGEVYAALSVVENCILVLSGDSAVDAQSVNLVEMIVQKYKLPLSIFVNKLDKENINFEEKISEIEKKFELTFTPIIVSSKTGGNLSLVNFLTQQQSDELYEKFIENVVSNDETLMEKYLNNEKIDVSQLSKVLKDAYKSLQLKFLFSGSALKNIGVKELTDFIVDYFVSSDESEKVFGIDGLTAGLVFKTTSEPGMGQMNYVKVYSGKFTGGLDIKNLTKNTVERIGQMAFLQGKKRIETPEIIAGDIGVLIKLKEARTNDILALDNSFTEKVKKIDFPEPLTDMAIVSKSKGEEEKVGNAFSNVILEEPTIRFRYNTETRQMVVSGIGFTQLDVIVKRIKSRYNLDIELQKPKIPYKETIKKPTQAEGKYKRQSGGRGQYGHCFIKVEPLERGKGFEFVDQIFGGAIPKNYIPSVEKGVLEKMADGVIAGYPVVDIKVILYDGSYHEVDSSDMAFKIAARMALQKAVLDGNPCILEPIMDVEIKVPEEYLGGVMGDINSRRGRIMGFEKEGKYQKIKAQIPLAEMYGYTMDLRSLTKGAGKYTMKLSHYEELPPHLAQPLIDEYQKSKTQQEE